MKRSTLISMAAVAVVLGAALAALPAAQAGRRAKAPRKGKAARPAATQPASATAPAPCPAGEALVPCPTGDGPAEPCIIPTPTTAPADRQLKAFAEGSPFDKDYTPPKSAEGKRIWARSAIWQDAPKLIVEKWLSGPEPQTKGKYVLIEFWATWCPPCRRSIPLLNALHRKFGKDLVVIGISHEPEADVRRLTTHPIEYHSAIDTQARMKNELGVFGIPHVIIVEPGGAVIWEGFPLLKDYELTEKTIERILDVGRRSGALKSE